MLYLVIGLLISAIYPTAAFPQIEREDIKPFWILKRPQQESYFVGIGVAGKGENLAESRDRALKNALNDIATQIETSVFSEIYIKDTEKAGRIQQGCAEGLLAEALIDRLIGAVQAFAGEVLQGDDMTCLVLRVEEQEKSP